ncbi:hypothetical protein [Streptomyces sp. Wb2n-11]|uniref:hypothetical protein n=1 Tax=Streptomyces sp. Wb2n-11 TaxID=1030533 RepID=UPI000AEB5910|nr:hypothetical protein [Streptomyces sp. Wb2n-11]
MTGHQSAAPPVPAQVISPPPPEQPPARPSRRGLRAVLRWTVAVLVFGVSGAGVAYGVTEKTRTGVPGLRTEDDGPWVCPKLAKPVLPAGAGRPFDEGNPGEKHYADPAALPLPAPARAKPDPAFKGAGHRVPAALYLKEYAEEERAGMAQDLADGGLLDVTARGWTVPDSTSSRIYLVRFRSGAFAEAFFSDHMGGGADAGLLVNGVEDAALLDESHPSDAMVASTEVYVYDETAPRGPVHVRHGYIRAGDTVALIVQSRKGTAAAVPFHQTVVLRNQLLGRAVEPSQTRPGPRRLSWGPAPYRPPLVQGAPPC